MDLQIRLEPTDTNGLLITTRLINSPKKYVLSGGEIFVKAVFSCNNA